MLSLQTMPHPLTQIEIMHRLKKVGFTQEQAETQAEIATELHESNLATKQDVLDLKKKTETEFTFVRKDISELRKDMNQEFALVRNEFALVRTEMKLMESHIIIKMSVIMSGLLALFGAAQKVFGL